MGKNNWKEVKGNIIATDTCAYTQRERDNMLAHSTSFTHTHNQPDLNDDGCGGKRR